MHLNSSDVGLFDGALLNAASRGRMAEEAVSYFGVRMKLRGRFRGLSPREAKVLVCVLTALIAATDFLLPSNINVSGLYFICVVLVLWTSSVRWLWTCTAIFVLLTFGGIPFAPAPLVSSVSWINWLNRGLTALALTFAAVPVHLRLRAMLSLERTMAERDRAEEALQRSHAALEARVQERTHELRAEVAERVRTEYSLRESERSLRQLSVRLINAQDEERRNIARELHDSVGQYLAHSKMSLESWLKKGDVSEQGRQTILQITDSLDKGLSETRTISYLLHPPLLDELGLASAARAYVEGFARRSGIQAKMDIPGEMKRLPPGFELVLFRILQEGLTNVLRHAHSPAVDIRVESEDGWVALIVRDFGKGMPPELVERLNTRGEAGGVGLGGMLERVRAFHGNLKIESNEHGTVIRATLPLIMPDESLERTCAAPPALSPAPKAHPDDADIARQKSAGATS